MREKETEWESDKQTNRKTDKQRENKSNNQKAAKIFLEKWHDTLYDSIDLLSEDKNHN